MGALKQATQLLDWERERDALSDRLARLCAETRRDCVEGFHYVAKDGVSGEDRATRVRGRLLCALLRQIEVINSDICRVIYPQFEPRPSASFTDRVLGRIGA